LKDDKDIKELIKKAKESLKAALKLYEEGFYDFTASRSYYSMFYAVQAMLLTKDLSFSKHSAVIAAFGKEFIKTKEIPEKFHTILNSAFDLRNIGDYGSPGAVSKDKAKVLIEQAKELIKEIEEYLRNKEYNI
jgi:uncharacterized protein (UPF0332 family)